MSRVADPKTKITLLRAAEEVFAERGLLGAKVEEIARRAGVSKGAFYLHFESKEVAFTQLVESFLARCQSFFVPPSSYPGLPDEPSELLEFLFERDIQIYEFLWQNRAFLRILGSCDGEHDYLVEAFRTEVAQISRQWVDHWRREGLFRAEVDAHLAATLMGAHHELTLRMLGQEKRPPLEHWLRFALETFFRAYGSSEVLAALDLQNQRVTFDIHETEPRVAVAHRARRARPPHRGRVT